MHGRASYEEYAGVIAVIEQERNGHDDEKYGNKADKQADDDFAEAFILQCI